MLVLLVHFAVKLTEIWQQFAQEVSSNGINAMNGYRTRQPSTASALTHSASIAASTNLAKTFGSDFPKIWCPEGKPSNKSGQNSTAPIKEPLKHGKQLPLIFIEGNSRNWLYGPVPQSESPKFFCHLVSDKSAPINCV
jgi:hypothetical protein